MTNWIIKLLINALAVMITAWLLPGVWIDGYFTAIVVAIVLSLLNTFIKPILIVLTIPVTILSFGLFLIVINVLLILWADSIVDGFRVNGFFSALLFSIVLFFINSFLNKQGEKGNQQQKGMH